MPFESTYRNFDPALQVSPFYACIDSKNLFSFGRIASQLTQFIIARWLSNRQKLPNKFDDYQ